MRFFVATILLAGVCGGQTELGSLTGVVTDFTGTPIAKTSANLTLESAPSTRYSAEADERGAFRFDSLPAGVYTLQFQKPGFKYATIKSITFAAGEQVTLPAFVMDVIDQTCGYRRGSVSHFRFLPDAPKGTGSATNEIRTIHKASVKGATATLYCSEKVCGETRADANGVFQFPNLSAGDYAIRLKLPGFYQELLEITVRDRLDAVYSPTTLEACRDKGCNPARRPKPTGRCE